MKKLIISFLTLCSLLYALCGVALASPFIICDPYPTTSVQPTRFEMTMDGGAAFKFNSRNAHGRIEEVALRSCVNCEWQSLRDRKGLQ